MGHLISALYNISQISQILQLTPTRLGRSQATAVGGAGGSTLRTLGRGESDPFRGKMMEVIGSVMFENCISGTRLENQMFDIVWTI